MFLPAVNVRALLVILVAVCATPPARAGAQAPAPWFGTWQLDPGKSTKRPTPSPYRRVRTRIEPAAEAGHNQPEAQADAPVKVSYEMVGVRGGVTRMEWTGRFDGRDYPMQGVDYVMTNAYRSLDGHSYEIVVKVDGVRAATAVAVVSPDGRALTVRTSERDARGGTITTTAVYARQ